MRGLKKQRRMQIVGLALASVVAVMALLAFLPDDAFQLFRSPSELTEKPPRPGEVFKLGGLVAEGSVTPGQGNHFSFVITDGGAEVSVNYVGNDVRPNLFAEGQGTIATGKYVNGVFEATEILAKHDEEYMPREVVDALKEQGVYKGADDS